MSFSILGLGTAVPDTELTQADILSLNRKLWGTTPEQEGSASAILEHSGIRKRHIVLHQQVVRDVLEDTRVSQSVFLPKSKTDRRGPTTGQRMQAYARHVRPLAVKACRRALEQSALPPGDITHLVTVSCTGFYAPGFDIELIKNLGLPATTERTHVGFMGCHGALNGLRVARAISGSEPNARVLLCAAELCCLHYAYAWDPQTMICNAIFADGAAAVVGAAHSANTGARPAWQLAANGSCVFPNSEKDMTWTVGDHGFQMTLSKQVPALIGANLRPWLVSWLERQQVALADVASWAVHPGGPKIVAAVEEALGLPATATESAREVLSAYGNMSSPTILFLLDYLRSRQAPRPCVALAFGPGLTVEAALFR
jgi:predicted naringenin-chalcone synthase